MMNSSRSIVAAALVLVGGESEAVAQGGARGGGEAQSAPAVSPQSIPADFLLTNVPLSNLPFHPGPTNRLVLPLPNPSSKGDGSGKSMLLRPKAAIPASAKFTLSGLEQPNSALPNPHSLPVTIDNPQMSAAGANALRYDQIPQRNNYTDFLGEEPIKWVVGSLMAIFSVGKYFYKMFKKSRQP